MTVRHATPQDALNWKAVLAQNMKDAIKRMKAQGACAASFDCLMQNTRFNSNTPGAPRGTNARFYYIAAAREIAQTDKVVSRFIMTS